MHPAAVNIKTLNWRQGTKDEALHNGAYFAILIHLVQPISGGGSWAIKSASSITADVACREIF